MADFAAWVTAAEPALGCTSGAFLRVYRANRSDANSLALESSPIVPYLRQIVAGSAWSGTATDLLKLLDAMADGNTRRLRAWPKGANSLSGTLRPHRPIVPHRPPSGSSEAAGDDGRWSGTMGVGVRGRSSRRTLERGTRGTVGTIPTRTAVGRARSAVGCG
jgi:hypothetical protein